MKCRHNVTEDKCAFCKADKRVQPVDDLFSVRDNLGRKHGVQPQIGTGTIEYQHGRMTYLDDGNGNVWDENDPSNWEDDQ